MKLALVKTLKEIYSVILKDLSAYGGFPFYGIAIVASLLANSFMFAQDLAVSLIAVTAIVAAVRLSYFKPRPGMPKRKYSTFYERIDNSSFPSIHAARTIMLSIAFYTKAPILLPVFALLAVAVLLSRIHFKKHDAVDLLVGCAIGFLLGYYFFI